eukprot:g9469.t1
MMAGINVMSFSRDDEQRLLDLKKNGVANQSETVALKKYGVQKFFREELSVDDICTFIRKKRVIMNACSMLKLSVEERAEFFLADARGGGEYDFIRSDYLALRHMDSLLRVLGYSGLDHRTKSVNLMALDANPRAQETSQEAQDGEDDADLAEEVDAMELADAQRVDQMLHVIKRIRKDIRIKTGSKVTEMKAILKNIMGMHLKGSKGPRPERVFEHKMQEIDDIWRIARIPNVFFDDTWKTAMAVRVADLRKGSKRGVMKSPEWTGRSSC